MRRPVVFLFLFFSFGIALEFYLAPEPFFFLFLDSLLVLTLSIVYILERRKEGKAPEQLSLRKKRNLIGLGFLFLLAMELGAFCFSTEEQQRDPLESKAGKTCTMEGRILTVQIRDEINYQMLVQDKDGVKRLIKVKGGMEDPAAYVGNHAVIRGRVELPSGRRNPAMFDYRLYLKTRGVRVILKSESGMIEREDPETFSILNRIAMLKYGFLHKLEKEMEPEAYGLLAGMLFGDCSMIGEDTYEAFQKNGIAHILSVSGIHTGIVYLFVSRLLGRRKTRSFYLITAAVLVFYAALSEFSPSVVRAVIMILIHILSKVIYRRYDFLSCTAASAMIMLLANPFYLFNTGFQLSYLAVFCLAVLLPWMERRIRLMEEKGTNGLDTESLRFLSPLLIIQAGMAPFTAYLFNYFSFASLIINIPVIAISALILPMGIVLIPLSQAGGILFGVGALGAEVLVSLVLWLNELFYLPGLGYVNAVSPPILFLLFFYGMFFLLFSEYFRILWQRGKKKAMAASCFLILVLSLAASGPADSSHREPGLVFVDVGQGDCLHIRTPEGRNILIDGGGSASYKVGEKILLPYLLKNGVSFVDLAIATHLHEDHYQGLEELAGKMEVRRLGIYEANRLREKEILGATGLRKDCLLYLTAGDRIWMEKDVWIDVLYPRELTEKGYESLVAEEKDENRSSLILKVQYRGLTVMMTGDLGIEGERMLMRCYGQNPGILHANVLKIGHHGSRFSTGDEFLEAVRPKTAVFQVGKNNFGHPHPSVIEKCRGRGIMIFRNDADGAIMFQNEGDRWVVDSIVYRNKFCLRP